MSLHYELHRFASAEALSQAVARRWWQALAGPRTPAKSFTVGLSGGRIARLVFGAVASSAVGRTKLMEGVDFFWADERCVPPGDPESNFHLAWESMLRPSGVDASRVHRVYGEMPPGKAAVRASAELRSVAALSVSGVPTVDLILLGMGEDGHVASLFPGEPPEVVASMEVYRAVAGPKPPLSRVTMGYPVIWAARDVWVVASGAGKENALRNSLGGGDSTPLGRAIVGRSHTVILTDIDVEE